jgi:hypothetical protein
MPGQRYTAAEDALVKDPTYTLQQIAEALGRSFSSVANRRSYLRNGGKSTRNALERERRYHAKGWHGPRRIWTDADKAAIVAPDRPSDVVLSHQIKHSMGSIHGMRRKLKGKWTTSRRSPDQRSRDHATYYGKGSWGPRGRQRWTEAEDKQIIAANRPTDQILSDRLGRTIHAIEVRRTRITRD